MLTIRDIAVPSRHDPSMLYYLAANTLRIPTSEITALKIRRRSIDARKKDQIQYIYTVDVSTRHSEKQVLRQCRSSRVSIAQPYYYRVPKPSQQPTLRPVVIGFGPGGMFAALALALSGLRPIVIERGQDAESRRKSVRKFWETGCLDPESNVQFGEGGAGTFSDGKLSTGTKNERMGWILQQMVAAGADESILYDAKPHVGTDVLITVVQRLRERILSLGGEVRFGTKLTGIRTENGKISGAELTGPEGTSVLPCDQVILALGHSARDTFEMLELAGIPMEPKPFSMGVRIEHLQADIDRALWGPAAGNPLLGAAPYKLSVHLPETLPGIGGRGVFSFCMCPGGYVVAAASEPGGVVTNGMRLAARDGVNANAGLLANVFPSDLPGDDPLAGVELQRRCEQRAYELGGGDFRAPAQLVGDFLAHRPSEGPRAVLPTYPRGVAWGEVDDCLPAYVRDALRAGLPLLARKLPCYGEGDAVLTGVESRSSSPVRVTRGDDLRSLSCAGLWPCGEGGGYAGGIMSAAADGIRVASALADSRRGQ